jgi:hypothetical protein
MRGKATVLVQVMMKHLAHQDLRPLYINDVKQYLRDAQNIVLEVALFYYI